MKTYILISVASLLLFLSLLVFTLNKSRSVTDLDAYWHSQPVGQQVENRIWQDIYFNQVGASEEYFASTHMRFDQNGFIYVSDSNRMQISKYNQEAVLINRFGLGEGRGPGEFSIIIDLMFAPDGRLWVMDGRSNRVTIFDTEDQDEWRILDLPEVFNRVIPVENGFWLQKRLDSQLKRYTMSGEKTGVMETLVEDPPLWYFVLDGYFATVSDCSIIQAHYHINTFAKYSSDGVLQFFRKPVSPPALPKIDPYYANDIGRVNTVDFSTWEQITRKPQVVGNTIQVMVQVRDKESGEFSQGFMDVYSLKNGDYLFSYRLPERLQSIAISDQYVAGITSDLGKLVIWEWNTK